jgi:peptide/nickel transport system substrate-binding protein
MRRRDVLKATPLLFAPALARADTRPLRFIPNANLTSIDPVWTTALVAAEHAYMVFDTLYGIDDAGQLRPQMCAGHELSDDRLTWTFTLRDGLMFHDGEKVLAKDCVMSVKRWASRDSFGQVLIAATNELTALDDRRFQFRLKKPFSQMLYGLGARNCFVMPERIAQVPGTQQIKEAVGSGPFRFLPDEWVSGARAGWRRFEKYEPRQEPASFYAGGKVARFEKIEWIVQPDPGTAAAALRTGEVDWIEQPLIDLAPMLKGFAGISVGVLDPFGWHAVLQLNHLQPPFSNKKLRQALWPAIDQKAFLESVIGDQSDLARLPSGYFCEGQPMASHAGLDVLTKPRDLALARKLVQESGYTGEKVVMLSSTDRPLYSQMALVARELFLKLGLNVDYQPMDWGTVVSRRTSRSPVDQGGWSTFNTALDGMTINNPGSNFALRGSGTNAWFGWPDDPELERLRASWFDAPDLASRKAIAEQVQLRAIDTVPYIPLGQMFQPTAYRSNIRGFIRSPFAIFWNVHRA